LRWRARAVHAVAQQLIEHDEIRSFLVYAFIDDARVAIVSAIIRSNLAVDGGRDDGLLGCLDKTSTQRRSRAIGVH
jgi:hypothetical protein